MFVSGSENCLFVNVYTPNPNAGNNFPVVVFIHGGAFMYGAASHYDTSTMMDKDMVVVSLNYRLGPLGKTNLHDHNIIMTDVLSIIISLLRSPLLGHRPSL
jgi:carboxylesterase type B